MLIRGSAAYQIAHRIFSSAVGIKLNQMDWNFVIAAFAARERDLNSLFLLQRVLPSSAI
jgi:hypothetical protein